MRLTRFALRHPWTVVVVVLALLAGAWLGVRKMARDVFPPLGIPVIYVAQPYGGMDAQQMEGFLTYYYEYHFLYITGIEHVESKTIQGASVMKLQFHPGTDMASAMAETIAYVNRARAFMPPGTPGPFVTRFDAGSVPVGNLVFSTENPARTVGQMQDAALNMVRPLFATLPGVSAPPPFGGSARTVVVNVKPDRLRAAGLTPDEVVRAVSEANTISPSGNLALPGSFPVVPVNAVVRGIQELGGVVLKSSSDGAVFLRDVAEVSDASDQVTSYALVNGRRTVYMPVTKRSDASTLEVVRLVRENLPKFQAACPEDIRVTLEFDQSPWVVRAIDELVREGVLGAVLTGLMVLVFLRDVRGAVIVVLNIPVALGAALLGLWVTGATVNLMTLGGLALAVGILVDEATVTMESIHAHRERSGGGGRLAAARSALEAAGETALPRLLAMLCILAVFVPAFFMEGAARALFVPVALAVGFSMVASWLLSSTLVPVLAVWWAPGGEGKAGSGGSSGGWRWWAVVSAGLLRLRWLVVPAALLLALAVVVGVLPKLGRDLFPQVDAGQLQLRLRAPAGTPVEDTEKIAQRVLAMVAERAGGADKVAVTMGLIGVHAPNYPVNLIHQWNSGPGEAVLQVQLREGSGVAVASLREALRADLAAEFPAVGFSFEPADMVSRVMSFGSPTPVEVAVSGKDYAVARRHAELLRDKLAGVPGLRDVGIGQMLDYPSVDVRIDRERAGLLGVRMSDATRSLVAATASSRFTVPNYWADVRTGVSYSVQVQVPPGLMGSVEELRNLPVGGRGGEPVPLRSIAEVTPGNASGQFDRYNMARTVSVTANLEGIDLGRAVAAVERVLGEAAAPAGVSVAMRGQAPVLAGVEAGLSRGLAVAVAVVFLLLLANFQSVRLALVAVAAVPLVLAGVVLALWLSGTALSLQSFMGSIMAVGVALANAILLVSAAAKAAGRGLGRQEAAVEAARGRVRAILMTAGAMMAGMVPMALGGGQTAPLAVAVLGGLASGTLATLLVLPSVYAMLAPGRAVAPSLLPEDMETP
ncbi:MAG: Multidrug resistance protein MdtC [Verrucomicrobiota bacterium]|jgi:multidrug efflux pump subunit AcrB